VPFPRRASSERGKDAFALKMAAVMEFRQRRAASIRDEL